MKFDEIAKEGQDELEVDGDVVIKTRMVSSCDMCEEETHWASISFYAHFCSSKCLNQCWEGFWERQDELHKDFYGF